MEVRGSRFESVSKKFNENFKEEKKIEVNQRKCATSLVRLIKRRYNYPKEKKLTTSKPMKSHEFKYEFMSQGPIFLTAAHSAMLLRGHGIEDDEARIHWREQWVSYIILRLSYFLNKIHEQRKKSKLKATKVAP